ncbi:hypothetical protein BTR23_13350 [Alkalihalophilus pseudofirmus]|nr:hypothetical protein BTR23_13350 [Alkalihalophilus pseudofirmus]
MNLGLMLRRNAVHYPEKLAVIIGDERLTYREFNNKVNKVANGLVDLGVKKGDKVAMLLPNSIEILELFWAVAKIGAVVVPLNPMVKGKDNAFIINNCSPKLLVVAEQYISEIDPIKKDIESIKTYLIVGKLPNSGYQNYNDLKSSSPISEPNDDVKEDDLYNIMYSSGTTGLPKGIMHSHRTRIMYAFLFGMEYGITFDSRVMAAGSLVFNGSLALMFPTICAGGTYVVLPKYQPEVALQVIEEELVTHTMLVPTQTITLIDSPMFNQEKLSSLRVLLTLGAPLPTERKKQVMALLPGILYEQYGLTEGFMTTIRPQDTLRKLGSVGPPLMFNEYKIVDEQMESVVCGEVGEIIARGPTVMQGYYNNIEVTKNTIVDGNWVKTGDLGYSDEDGFIYLVDRKKDMIISGGVNVYPRDIEETIAKHEAVSECAVFGMPHEKWGEVPAAMVILKENKQVSDTELISWVNERVAAKYMRLHYLQLVEQFPRTASGKILKRKMRDELKMK